MYHLAEEIIDLITPGFLGSCWYGKYHYLEPWVGCEHNCTYCYTRSRKVVHNTLNNYKTTFENPVLLHAKDELLALIEKSIKQHQVKILKLCRYTDIFTPCFVTNGLAYEVLKTICESDVERIIITTKGIPNDPIISLMEEYKNKFSYNVVVKPECEDALDPNLPERQKRLELFKKVKQIGVASTIHMDPLAFSVLHKQKQWQEFIAELKDYDVDRVMFSYLFLDAVIIQYLRDALPGESLSKLLSMFDIGAGYHLPDYVDQPLIYMNSDLRKQHAMMLAKLLDSNDIDYVLCSLKSAQDNFSVSSRSCNLCDGTFYA